MTKLSIEQLRALPGMTPFLTTENNTPFSLLPNGMPPSGIVELSGPFGSGKTEVVLRFLSENPSLQVAWMEKDFTIFPAAFPQFSIELSRILFIDVSSPTLKQSPFWCASQILKSGLIPILIVSYLNFTEIDLRRLQLLAKSSLVILLKSSPTQSRNWSLSLQLSVQHSEENSSPFLTILKSRNSLLWPSHHR